MSQPQQTSPDETTTSEIRIATITPAVPVDPMMETLEELEATLESVRQGREEARRQKADPNFKGLPNFLRQA